MPLSKLDGNQVLQTVINEPASAFQVVPASGYVFPISGSLSPPTGTQGVSAASPLPVSGSFDINGSNIGVTSFTPTAHVILDQSNTTQAVSGTVSAFVTNPQINIAVTSFSPTADVNVTNPQVNVAITASSITQAISGSALTANIAGTANVQLVGQPISAIITNPQVNVAVTSFSPTAHVILDQSNITQGVSGASLTATITNPQVNIAVTSFTPTANFILAQSNVTQAVSGSVNTSGSQISITGTSAISGSVSILNPQTTSDVSGSNIAVTAFSPTAHVILDQSNITQAISGSALTANIAGTASVSIANAPSVTILNPQINVSITGSSITQAVSGSAITATIANPQVNVAVTSFSPTISANVIEILNIVDLLDSPLLSASGINSSTGAFVLAVASLAANVKQISVADTIGYEIYLISGSTTAVTNAGMDRIIPFIAASGAAVSAKYATDISPTAGNLIINFIG